VGKQGRNVRFYLSSPSHSPHSTTAQKLAMSTSQAVPSTSEPYFDTTSQKWMVETQQGTELEWDQHRNQWVPLVSHLTLPIQPCLALKWVKCNRSMRIY